MSPFYISPYLNYLGQNNSIVVWDNRLIRKLSPLETNVFLDVLNGKDLEAEVEYFACVKLFLSEGIILKGEHRAAALQKDIIHQDDSFTVHLKKYRAEFLPGDFYENLIMKCPLLKSFHIVFSDNLFCPELKNLLSSVKEKDILYVNLSSKCITIGPQFKLRDLEKIQRLFSLTWTTSVFNFSTVDATTAVVDTQLLDIFLQRLNLFLTDNSVDFLGSNVLSFDQNHTLRNHEIIFELEAPWDFQEPENFLKSMFDGIAFVNQNGGYRIKETQAVADYLLKYNDPITGIADYVDELELNGISTFRALSYLQFLLKGKYINLYAMGKGSTRLQSYVSCMAELIERFFSFTLIPKHDTRKFVYSDNLEAINPKDLLLYSQTQYDTRDPEEPNVFRRVPEQYQITEALEWVRLISLTGTAHRWCPKDYCYNPEGGKSKFFIPTSNGIAAGNSYAEAIFQGTLELVERDAAAIWWYNKVPRSEINLSESNIPVVAQALKFFSDQGHTMKVIEITSDLGVPCYVALSYQALTKGTLQMGFGCHVSNEIALTRAVTELIQTEAAKKLNQKNFKTQYSSFFDQGNYDKTFLNPGNTIEFKETVKVVLQLDEVLKSIIDKFIELGLDLYILNFSLINHPIKVVRVISPGLRSMMFELGLGRIFTVPVSQGHLARSRKESELNTFCLDI